MLALCLGFVLESWTVFDTHYYKRQGLLPGVYTKTFRELDISDKVETRFKGHHATWRAGGKAFELLVDQTSIVHCSASWWHHFCRMADLQRGQRHVIDNINMFDNNLLDVHMTSGLKLVMRRREVTQLKSSFERC